jgi:carbonic anhydrase
LFTRRLARRRFAERLAAASPILAAAYTEPVCTVFTKERQGNITPDQAIALLRRGNERLLAGRPAHYDRLAQVKLSAAGQAPFAAVLACMDSRVPPELVFDQGVGDIFCVRIAGNFINTDVAGSLEFATKIAGAKAIVVLGHTGCSAIKGAIDKVQLGHLTAALWHIEPAIESIGERHGERDSMNARFVQQVAIANAKTAAQNLQKRSAVIAGLVAAGQLKVAAAMLDLESGRVSWL